MEDSDFIISWIDEASGALFINDRFADPLASNGRGEPQLDTELGGTEDLFRTSGVVRISFLLSSLLFFLYHLELCGYPSELTLQTFLDHQLETPSRTRPGHEGVFFQTIENQR